MPDGTKDGQCHIEISICASRFEYDKPVARLSEPSPSKLKFEVRIACSRAREFLLTQ